MASKLQEYRRMSEEAQRQLTGSLERWQSFLATASRLYKYPYHEQVMIHAQRPDATACAEFDVWNNTMRRYVRRGSKGIALIDTSGDRERLRYVFDVSDTGTRPNSRSLNLWELQEEHIPVVSSMLEKNYGVPAGESLADQLEIVASQLAREYWEDNRRDILGILEDSFLEEYDEFNVGVAFRNAAEVSISYSLMLRCGLEPENYFEHEDFMSVFDFNTPETAGALGTAVSGINQQVLREIGATIRNYERQKLTERSAEYGNDVHAERGLSDPGHQTERTGGDTHREVRADAETVSEGASPDSLEPSGAVGAAVSAPSGDRRDGAPETGRADAADGEAGRRDGGTEAQRPDEMGGHDEYAEGAGRGDHSERAGVQLTAEEPDSPEELNNGYPAGTEFEQLSLNLFLSEQEQISQIDEADRTTEVLSAFSFAQSEIDDMLRFGSNTSHAREHIADAFQKQKPIKEIAALLQREFHGGYGIRGEHGDYAAWYDGDGIHLHKGREARYAVDSQVITWETAAERIGQLLDEGSFASNVELAEAGGRVRSELAQSLLYLKHDLSEEANQVGYFSSMDDLPAGYPDATAALAEKMTDSAFADTLRGEFLTFLNDYAENRELLRFHYHRMDELWQGVRDISAERREYPDGPAELAEPQSFITEDEISEALAGGSSVEGGKGRIYAYFTADHTMKEKADFLKQEYGIGGRSHALSRADHSSEDHSAKGIRLTKGGCAPVELNWTKAAERVDSLIRKDRYLSPEEQELYQQNLRRNSIYNTYNDVKHDHPDDMVLFQVGDFFELYGEDARQAAELLDIRLTTRNIPGVGHVDMCGVPSHALDRYVEQLRAQFDVTVSAVPEGSNERSVYTLRAFAQEIDLSRYDIGYGAMGNGVTVWNRKETENGDYKTIAHIDPDRTVKFYDDSLPDAIKEQIQRFADSSEMTISATQDASVFSVSPAGKEPVLEAEPAAAPKPVTADEISDAIIQWNGSFESKSRVNDYMLAHGRERGAAAWLKDEFGGADTFSVVTDHGTLELPWAKVQRQLGILVNDGRFFTEADRMLAQAEQIAAQSEVAPYERFTVIETDEGYGIWDDLHDGLYVDEDGVTADFDSEWVAENYLIELKEKIAQREAAEWEYVERSKYEAQSQETEQESAPAADVSADTNNTSEMESEPHFQDDNDLIGAELTLDGRRFAVDDVRDGRASLRDITFQNGTGFPIFRNEPVDTVRGILFPEKTTVPQVNLEAELTEAELALMRPQLDAAGIDYLVANAGYNRRTISFSSQHYREVQDMLDALPDNADEVVYSTETDKVYPGEQTGLPYDIVTERLRTEPEHTPPEPGVSTDDAINANPVSVQIGGEWQTFPNTGAAEQAMYEEYKAQTHRNAQNFRITDSDLGAGGAKAKYQANISAIRLLKQLEDEGLQASPDQQEVLSRYVGWGGLADAFDPEKENWRAEYAELKELLTPEEYEAARASTLNAHYTSPTVIHAMYEALENMGFESGNILEPSMGVGNFFGCLPESMQNSRLYGVELDSITGRIAKQLYPKADITVAGFETTDRRDFYDVAIGNVPFGQYQVNDRAYNRLGFSIHDYFFAKTLDQVRPGGVIAFVTSRYTMDKQSPEVRRYIAQRAELLGAIRLPNNAFKANAGTDVVSDIIFLQKRGCPIEIEPDWVHLGRNEDGFAINSYFVEHPEMILGRQSSESTQYGRQDFTVEPIEGLELADQLHDAVKYIRGTYQAAELPELGDDEALSDSIPADPNVKNYSYTVVDGEVYYRQNSLMSRPALNATASERVKGLVGLRDCLHHLIDLQMDAMTPDSAIRQAQAELNTLYDSFTAKYGLINSRANALAFQDDSSYYLLCTLEELDEEKQLKRKADIFTKRTIKPHEVVTSVDTPSEALALSISEKACVDLPYMTQLTGMDESALIDGLQGVIFRDPVKSEWQTADEYLSGNVRQKLREAEQAASADPAYLPNVEALRSSQPKDLDASEIEVRLGATWIDQKYIQQFMEETFEPPYYLRRSIQVHFSPFTAEWSISGKSQPSYNDVNAYMTYGTERARTRFAKFFNLPELMTLFKEVADIKTSDQLHLPVPEAVYHNVVAQPTEIQQAMVQELSERAAKVHAGAVDASVDNMLRITTDGRKLGLDQRIINPDLPDDPSSKVNMCVDNIYRIWDEGQADKLTQLVFCDLSTPKTGAPAAKAAKAVGGNLDSPELHAVESQIDITPEPEFTVYDDIREKLVARGIPREQIAFIHEANTEARKKELFAKVRSGQVRVLMGSTFKMGAGMNVQDRLVALHDLDAPWRPGDLEQRSGRIIRQGNRNKQVHIFRYVTEATFDAYLWQTLENKQKFISQIMTSKSPVRSCEDIDETALSYAEIKALCAGDERIKEKMDLDVDVARLKLMKANHQSQQYRLEDNILRHFPEQIEQNKGFIAGFQADMQTLAEHPHPQDGFAGMTVRGDVLTDKENAGAALVDAMKEVKGLEPVPIGSYRGFQMSLTLEDFGKQYVLTLKGKMSHRVELGKDPRGNLIRIDNALAGMETRLARVQEKLDSLYAQMDTAKAELGKPFPQEQELKEKSARLAQLNIELNIDDRTPIEAMVEVADSEPEVRSAVSAKSERPSVLAKLHAPLPQRDSHPKQNETEKEVR